MTTILDTVNTVSTVPTGLKGARIASALYYEDEFQIALTYGGVLGIGKSSYDMQVMAEAYGDPVEQKQNWKKVKKRLWHPPKAFTEALLKMKRRDKLGTWDDAGLWLFALDWRDPFVIAVTKYLNVARTDWGMLRLNAPHPRFIVKRIQIFPEIIYVKITKIGSNIKNNLKPRYATAYRTWELPDMKKTGVRKIYRDKFNAIMPDEIFKWYKPRRDRYARIAKILMLLELKRLTIKEKRRWFDDQGMTKDFDDSIPEDERIKDLQELIQHHTTTEVDQKTMTKIEQILDDMGILHTAKQRPVSSKQVEQIDKEIEATQKKHWKETP